MYAVYSSRRLFQKSFSARITLFPSIIADFILMITLTICIFTYSYFLVQPLSIINYQLSIFIQK
jgi:hypothetical protein